MLIELIRGDDRAVPLSTAVTLTDADQITFTAKRRYADADADAVIRKDLADGVAISDTDASIAVVTFTPDDTNEMTAPRLFLFDLEVVDEDGKTKTVIYGYLRIVPDVTREADIGS